MRRRGWLASIGFALLVCASCAGRGGDDPLWRVAIHYDLEELTEPSGLVASRRHKGVFWTLNDSGGQAEIFGIDREGLLRSHVRIRKARNVDWEAITMDDRGRLLICDFGNNGEDRKTFRVYVVKEPSEEEDRHAKVKAEVPFRYPEDGSRSINAEACFWADGRLHVLTKTEDQEDAHLYRFGELEHGERQTLVAVGGFPVGSKVTGADVSADGLRLAILSYEYLLVFERSSEGVPFFDHSPRRILLEAGQCEAIAWDGDDLLIVNEQGDLHVLTMFQWKALEEYLPSKPEDIDVEPVGATGSPYGSIPLVWSDPGHVLPGAPAPGASEPGRAWIGWDDFGLVLDLCWPGTPQESGVAGMLMIGQGTTHGLSAGPDNVAWVVEWQDRKTKRKKRRAPVEFRALGEARSLSDPVLLREGELPSPGCEDGTAVRARIPRRAIPGWTGVQGAQLAFNLVLLMPDDDGQWSFSGDTSTWCWDNVFLWGTLRLTL